ncbi:BMT2 family SAM-dependent methyltransferase [bacterium]|nr:BMT2 family SAM-dependent methyltransferase [bacterium]|tara:strand:- start:37924 stop:38790 length:867 start_codon:yes stop_codon:yes gene_type:complete
MAKKRSSGPPKPLVPSAMKSLKRARHVTSEFHRIQRELNAVAGGGTGAKGRSNAHGSSVHSKKELEQQLEGLGGRQAYQEASVLTTQRHRTCKWVFAVLTKRGMRPGKNESPLKLLEVGAVNTQLLSVPWLNVRAIDIKSQHPRIEQKNFFDIKAKQLYTVVVCSMVLNCVATAAKRGKMLALAHAHLKPGGYFFLMIPRRCIENSPFCDEKILTQSLDALGMQVIDQKMSPKLAFFCVQRVEGKSPDQTRMKKFPNPPKVKVRSSERVLNDQFGISFHEETMEGIDT